MVETLLQLEGERGGPGQSDSDALHGGTYYRLSGRGNPVVLIHGVGADLTMWDAQVAALGTRYAVVRYDMLGHGGTAKPPGERSLADFVRQLLILLDHLKWQRATFVGFSMGGMVAQAFAVRHPERVERLAILNAVYDRSPAASAAVVERAKQVARDGPAANVEVALKRWFTPAYAAAHPEVLAAVRQRMETNDLQGYLNAYRVFATGDRELVEAIRAIACPTLVATGALDPNSTPEMARRMAEIIPNAKLEIWPGLAHMTPVEGAKVVNLSLLRFLAAARATLHPHGRPMAAPR
ncbi:MAG: alpha/beta fold hydrolase [Alphaproteobacteria bacterium]|nr:alpha/beta fold hydrolase [Alphaproteobacteria bacterium]